MPESERPRHREEQMAPRTLLEMIAANRITQAIYVAAELGIADT